MYLKNKHRLLYSLFFFVTTQLHIPIHSADDLAFDFFDDNPNLALEPVCTNADPADVVMLLIDDLDALCILQQDFYKRTNELNQRSLLDYGLFLPQKFYARDWEIGAHIFYNQTTRDNFTRKSTALCSYLAIFNETLLNEIQRRAEELTELPFQLREVLPLFANTTVQERRTGAMFHGMRRWGQYRFRFLFPFYYLESNIFLTPQEIDLIQAALGITDPTDDMEFARNNLIADKVGLGDLRLNFDFPFTNMPGMTTKIGVQATIPTAFSIKNGLYGSTFKKRCRGPLLDFCKLFDLATEKMDFDAIQNIVTQFGQDALEQFNANLIELPMGNGGHFGVGAYIRSKTPLNSVIKRPWADNITMRSRMSVEYLFPHRQNRYFIEGDNKARFAALGLDRATSVITDQVTNDPAYARAVLGFLESQLTDKVFPFSLSTKVQPGIIFRWMTKYIYETNQRWGYFVGTDTWLTTKERLSDIRVPEGFPTPLNCKIARKPFGYQVGFMGNLFWKRPSGWLLTLNGQYDFTSTGIGSDFLLSFNFEKSF
ncbi:MAG: hypothetical protein WD055_01815 [Candidatus Dependentiae bacterium]